ncbi:MAG: hypothetical protein WA667_16270 [Candidatus Nitrosopolaris sp.]
MITPESLGSLAIRYIHFFSSIMWWGIMFFMFVIIFPANKGGIYSTLFPRVQRFMKVIASIALASGILLTLVNTKFTIERLFSSSWGYTILTGATISVFVYVHILMQNRSKTTTAVASSLLMPSTSTSLSKNANTMNNNKNGQKRKISKRFIPWLLFILLTTTVALMVYASNGLF